MPVLTYAVSRTSAWPACMRCAAPPATNAVPSAARVRVIVLSLDERFYPVVLYPMQLVDGAGWSALWSTALQ